MKYNGEPTNTYLDKKESKAVVKKPVQQKAGPMVSALNNIRKPLPKPKPRQENMVERIERINYEFGDETVKKPAHYDNPLIVDYENWGRKPKPFKNEDKSTYPSDRDQAQQMSTWDLLMESAKKNPRERGELRKTIMDDYKRNGKSNMGDDELRMKGKHPDQIKKLYEETKPAVFELPSTAVKKYVAPQKPIEQIIKERADARLEREQKQYDKQWGTAGITKLMRPT